MPTVLLDNETHSLIVRKQKEFKDKFNIDMQIGTLANIAVRAGIDRITIKIET